MRRLLLILALLALPGVALAQYAQPTGTFTRQHALAATGPTGSPYQDAGGANGSDTLGVGYLTELGVTNTGLPVCVTDNLISAAGGFHQLCVGSYATVQG